MYAHDQHMEVHVEVSTEYQVIRVDPSRLHTSPQQPRNRTDASASMNALKSSIAKVGLQYPPLVITRPDGDFQIVDGHRRVHALIKLGHRTIPVLPTQGKPDTLFAEVSGHVAKMTATQWIEVYLAGGTVPSGVTRTCITKLEEVMGRGFLELLVKKGWSPQIWNASNRVVKYLGLDAERDRPEVLRWLINVGTQQVSAWITGDDGADGLMEAFKGNRKPTAM